VFIVVFEQEENATCYPMGRDPKCEGALQADSQKPVVFASRKAARTAIRVSTCNAHLREAQGKPVNEDFTTLKHNLRIVPLIQWNQS